MSVDVLVRPDEEAPDDGSKLYVPQAGLLLPGYGLLVDIPEPMSDREFSDHMEKWGVPPISGGAFSASGLYVLNWIDILDATQLAIDLSLTTHKWAMYTNTETPNYSTETAYSATNEVAANGDYAAGGKILTGLSPTVTESPAGTLMYDMNDVVWASPTTVTARGAKEYADVLAGNNLIVGMTFGGSDITSTAGTFTIQFNALGVLTIDLVP